MNRGLQTAILVGALFGFGLGGQGHAATDAKKTQQVAKKSDNKVASAKTHGSKSAAKAPAKPLSQAAAHKAPVKHASLSHGASRKAVRKVSMGDVDPAHLLEPGEWERAGWKNRHREFDGIAVRTGRRA